jgi:hypothetical protein
MGQVREAERLPDTLTQLEPITKAVLETNQSNAASIDIT